MHHTPNIQACQQFLTWFMRHGAEAEKVRVTGEGWINLVDILNTRPARKRQYDAAMIVEIVVRDSCRFSYKASGKTEMVKVVAPHSLNTHTDDASQCSRCILRMTLTEFSYTERPIRHGTGSNPMGLSDRWQEIMSISLTPTSSNEAPP